MIAIPLDSHFCITFTDAKDNNPGFNSFYVSDFGMSIRHGGLFSWASVILFTGVHVCQVGHTWQGSMPGRGCAWQGGMHGSRHAWWGHAWQGGHAW